jgi:hypothetical protein
MQVDGITAVAALFLVALMVQSAPELVRLIGSIGRLGSKSQPLSQDDWDRLVSLIFSVVLGLAAVFVAHFGALTALGVPATSPLEPWGDAVFTVFALASGADKISLLKSLAMPTGPVPTMDSGTVEVTGTVKVSKPSAV